MQIGAHLLLCVTFLSDWHSEVPSPPERTQQKRPKAAERNEDETTIAMWRRRHQLHISTSEDADTQQEGNGRAVPCPNFLCGSGPGRHG